MKKSILIAALLILFAPALHAQQADDYKNHPGYIDFGSFDKFQGAEETVEVFIKGPLLKFAAKAAEQEDPDLASLLKNLKLVKVNVFSMDKLNIEDARSIMESVSKRIDKNKWELMVRTKEPGEYVEIYTQFGPDDSLTGLVVMAVQEKDEAVFVNIVGDIDPAKLGKLSDKFNIPKLNSLEIEAKSQKGDHHEK
jgi:hypothetical protein